MDKESVPNLLLGGSIASVFSYLVHLFTKRSDRADKMEERIVALEIAAANIEYIKDKQASVDQKIDQILELVTELRIQQSQGTKRTVKRGSNA